MTLHYQIKDTLQLILLICTSVNLILNFEYKNLIPFIKSKGINTSGNMRRSDRQQQSRRRQQPPQSLQQYSCVNKRKKPRKEESESEYSSPDESEIGGGGAGFDLEQLLRPESHERKRDKKFENEYYLYDDITQDSMMELSMYLKNIHKKWTTFLHHHNDVLDTAQPKPIKIYIQSNGGDLHAVLPVIDYIHSLRGIIPVYTYVEGLAASAASLIAVCGEKRTMTRNSFLLIHELRTQMSGTYSNFRDESSNCNKLMSHIKRIYISNSGGRLTEQGLDNLLTHDYILSAQECLDMGLIDEILG